MSITGTIAAHEINTAAWNLEPGTVLTPDIALVVTAGDYGPDRAVLTSTVLVSGVLLVQDTSPPDTAAMNGAIGVAGTLWVQEVGPDVAQLTGAVSVTGLLDVSESGIDAASLSGAVAITGTLAVTETGIDLASFNGVVVGTGNILYPNSISKTPTLSSVSGTTTLTLTMDATP